jgi:glutamate/tyrosine decarboxylase-like PLP-dependent enzyme
MKAVPRTRLQATHVMPQKLATHLVDNKEQALRQAAHEHGVDLHVQAAAAWFTLKVVAPEKHCIDTPSQPYALDVDWLGRPMPASPLTCFSLSKMAASSWVLSLV